MLRTELIRPIPELVQAHAHDRGEKTAYRDACRSLTYSELAARTRRLAGHLRARRLGRGDRAVIYMDNSVEVAESYLAITRAAAVGVCVNPQAAEREASYMLEDSGARVILTDPAHLDMARTLAVQASTVENILVTGAEDALPAPVDGIDNYEDAATTEPGWPARDDLGLDEPAWMLYTSGTTGRPRSCLVDLVGRVLHDHRRDQEARAYGCGVGVVGAVDAVASCTGASVE